MRTKHCHKCNQTLDISHFGKDKNRKDGITFYCRSCINAYCRSYSRKNPSILKKSKDKYRKNKRKYRDWELRRIFGITIDQYEELLKKQNHVCAICNNAEQSRKSKTLAVDHCHKTGKVRGLLCSNCNLGIGNLQDSISIIESAIEYLSKSKQGDKNEE